MCALDEVGIHVLLVGFHPVMFDGSAGRSDGYRMCLCCAQRCAANERRRVHVVQPSDCLHIPCHWRQIAWNDLYEPEL